MPVPLATRIVTWAGARVGTVAGVVGVAPVGTVDVAGAGGPAAVAPTPAFGRAAFDARPPAVDPQAAQPADDQRVIGQGGGRGEQDAQHLVVAGRGQREPLTDGGLLRARLLPPGPLEVEDRPVAVGE